MKIAKAETILVSIPFQAAGTPPWSFGGEVANHFDTLMVRLETDNGIVGWGEAFSRNRDRALQSAIDSRILPLVIGKDPACIAQIKHDLEFNLHNFGRIGPIMYGISAVDIALWDILGKVSNLPLTHLLGGPYADRVEAYASLLRYSNEKDVARVTREAIDRGYRYIKLHEIGLNEIRSACEAAGKDARIMLDVNCPWTVSEALEVGRAVSSYNILWFEEPVWPPENYKGLAVIKRQGLHRIASGENAGSLHDFMAMIDADAIDIAQPDVAKTGGITEVLKIRSLCEAHGIEFVPHCALFGPGQVATIHLNAATRTLPLFERLYCDFEHELYGAATIPVDGFVSVPKGPGIGLDPDPKVIEAYRI